MTSLLTNGSVMWDQEVTLRVRYFIRSPSVGEEPIPNLRVLRRNCTFVDQRGLRPQPLAYCLSSSRGGTPLSGDKR